VRVLLDNIMYSLPEYREYSNSCMQFQTRKEEFEYSYGYGMHAMMVCAIFSFPRCHSVMV
jgi:hypothetical protein